MADVYTIGIAGGSGSGKTTFLQRLQKRFLPGEICIISQDNYYKSRDEQLTDQRGVKNFDLPSSLDLISFHDDVVRLMAGETVERQEYTFNNHLATPGTVIMKPAKVIIAEGLFTFCTDKLKSIFDLKIMIDATDDKKVIRRIKRDRLERNYPLEDVLYRYEFHVTPAYLLYIEPHKSDADLIINNNQSFDQALEVVTAFIRSKLK